jgi:hypothetical protein
VFDEEQPDTEQTEEAASGDSSSAESSPGREFGARILPNG